MPRLIPAILYVIGLSVILLLPQSGAMGQRVTLPVPEHITGDQGLPQAFNAAILQDRQGFIWIATLDGLCRYDGRNFKVFQPSADSRPSLSSAAVIDLKEDRDGLIWIITEKGTIDCFNPSDETFENVSENPHFQKAFPWKPCEVLVDSRNMLWISFPGHGVAAFNRQTQQTIHYRNDAQNPGSLSHDDVNGLLEDQQQHVWMAASYGLDRFDRTSGNFRHFRHERGNSRSLPENDIHGIYQRRDGSLLVVSEKNVSLFDIEQGVVKSFSLPGGGKPSQPIQFATDREGNNYFIRHGKLYLFHPEQGVQILLGSGDTFVVRSLLIDRNNVLWAGTAGQGTYKFNLAAGRFQALPYRNNFTDDLLVGLLGIPRSGLQLPSKYSSYYFRAAIDQKKRIWFNVGSTPFYRWDPDTRRLDIIPFLVSFNNYEPSPPAPLATDPGGTVWAVYDNIAAWYDEPGGTWHEFPHPLNFPQLTGDQTGYMRLLQFVVDDGNLWIITNTHGLFQVDRLTGVIKRHANRPQDASSLSSDALFCIAADPDDADILWIGTFGNGLCRFDKRTGTSRRFTEEEGLPNNVVYAAIPDLNGYLWLATNKGLCKLHRTTFATESYTHADGLIANEFNRFHFLRTADDRIILGGLEGITAFYPDQISEDSFEPITEITSIQINNHPWRPDSNSRWLPGGMLPLHRAEHIDLDSDQNFITVEFVGLQFNNPAKMRYRYLLEGVNRDWVVSRRPEASYTNLPPGTYTLRLNASNTSGQWSPHVRTLTLHIASPWWATWWAYAAYLLMVVCVIYIGVRLYVRQREVRQLREVDGLKTRFFTNITHEFRTPLTLILSPVRQLKKASDLPVEWKKNKFRLDLIENNANQLLQLVNQLLDLSKMEARTMESHQMPGDLTAFVRQLAEGFLDQANEKGLQLLFDSDLGEQFYQFDDRKLERIVNNLVGNAVKFTSPGGRIRVTLTQDPGGVSLRVTDTGPGIPESKLGIIFDRFQQADDATTRAWEGAGIGLALVKELTEFLGGHVDVKSKVGEGAAFTVFLPFPPLRDLQSPPSDLAPENDYSMAKGPVFENTSLSESPVLLLVEDNRELSDFIVDSFPDHFKIEQAFNGKEGLEKTLAIMPDIIISDVLMPVMDGFALCHQLKTDLRTSHIPVVLLTAKVSHDSRMAGFSEGADHYMTKPFHVDELLLRIANLLEQQHRYRLWLQSQMKSPPTVSEDIPAVTADPFIRKIYQLLEQNLDNTAYDVKELTRELGMHRSTLFRKLKTLVDLAPNDLIRDYRMRRAAQFLSSGAAVTDTAYRTGFDNLPYFSKCFRDQFGMTPSAYSRRHTR